MQPVSRTRPLAVFVGLLLVLARGGSAAARSHPSGDNLLGHRGLVRTTAALNHPRGYFGLGTDLQFFKASNLLQQGRDHSRMVNAFTVSWTPLRVLEAALAFHVISDSSSGGKVDELQVAVGDPQLSLKAGHELAPGLALAGLFDIRFPSGVGFFEPAGTASLITLGALGSWSGGARLPLAVHLNLGFVIDGSQNLFAEDDLRQLSAAQRFAAQVSSFDRLVTRLGVEYESRHLGPFLELSLEPFLGSGAPGFARSPGLLTFGARVWPTRTRGLQLLAALDLGLTGVGGSGGPTLDAGKYAYVIPRWNLVFRISYRFDPFARPPRVRARVEDQPPPPPAQKPGAVRGLVLDERTASPLTSAQVQVVGEREVSRLAVDPDSGTFRTYHLAEGKQTLQVTASGYEPATVVVQVEPGQEVETTVRLRPRLAITPGTIRGTVKAIGAASLERATVLIPELDRTVQVGPDGEFTVEVQPGRFSVIISAPGHRTQRKSLEVREGTTVILNVELHQR